MTKTKAFRIGRGFKESWEFKPISGIRLLKLINILEFLNKEQP